MQVYTRKDTRQEQYMKQDKTITRYRTKNRQNRTFNVVYACRVLTLNTNPNV